MRKTARDRTWLVVIDALRDGRDLTTADVVEDADVSDQTARGVLRVAQDEDLLSRESERAQTWHVAIGPLGEVEDWEYRRAIETLIEEAKSEL
ncbi:hypothetical protein [Halomontanus rarus]|uniref:hypothetical protein n=1 Tax=Halomontanus rarus TaxID=3034020 RepID=UPI001A986A0F